MDMGISYGQNEENGSNVMGDIYTGILFLQKFAIGAFRDLTYVRRNLKKCGKT